MNIDFLVLLQVSFKSLYSRPNSIWDRNIYSLNMYQIQIVSFQEITKIKHMPSSNLNISIYQSLNRMIDLLYYHCLYINKSWKLGSIKKDLA
jgi:hypothetical protein